MKEDKEEERKTTLLLATGFLTEYAFLKSLSQSKTLMAMVIIAVVLFGGLGLFLYKMAGT